MSKLSLSQQLLAVLFAAGEPVSLAMLAKACQAEPAAAARALAELDRQTSGILVTEKDGEYCLATHPGANATVERYFGSQTRQELSKPALETLSVIAYNGPATRAQVDEIRGVSSEQTIRGLLARGLIEECGQADSPGKPILYRVTFRFLHHLGLASTAELPPLMTEEGS